MEPDSEEQNTVVSRRPNTANPTVTPSPKPSPKPPGPPRRAPASAGQHSAESKLVGMIIEDRYRLERLLGSGGMSQVYLGTHLRAGGKLAIKLIDLHLSNKPDMVRRCLQEVRTMMEITSNYVVRAHDVGVLPSGQLFIVMEHLAGEDLEHLVQREGPIAWARAAEMGIQICGGLSAAHKCGTIHRDIKPQNCIRISLDGNHDHIKLIDFGIARDTNAEAGLTQDGMILGTPEYMAPELVVAGTAPDARSDLYALGALLYKLLTGNPPFRGRDALDTLYQHRNSPVVAPSVAAPKLDIPPEADEILLRALAKDPADRFASADEMSRALRLALGQRSGLILRPESTGPVPPLSGSQGPRSPTQPLASHEASSPGRMPPGQEMSTSAMRSVTARDVVVRGVMLLSLGLFFGVASWLAAPAPPDLTASEPPVAAKQVVTLPGAQQTVAAADPPAVADPSPVPAMPPDPAPVEPAPVEPTVVAEPMVAEPAPVEPPAVAEPPPVEPPPTAADPSLAPDSEPAAGGGVIEPDFNYRTARKYIDEQKKYLMGSCLVKAEKPSTRLNMRFDVRPSGRPSVKIFSPSKAVRDCARVVLSFTFDSSPRGGAFTYVLNAGSGSFEKQPVDPLIVK